jgi:hypothetical protein
MENLFFIFIAFAFVNISTEFFYESEEIQESDTPFPEPSPLVTSCTNKVKHDNVTEVKHCVESVEKHWGIDEITPEMPRNNRTLCCYQYDLIKCFLKYMPKICNQQEIKAIESYKIDFIKAMESQSCNDWPFNSEKCYSGGSTTTHHY